MQDPTLFNVAQQIGMRATAQRWLSGWVGPVKFWPETTNNCSAEICATLAGLLSGSIPTAKRRRAICTELVQILNMIIFPFAWEF